MKQKIITPPCPSPAATTTNILPILFQWSPPEPHFFFFLLGFFRASPGLFNFISSSHFRMFSTAPLADLCNQVDERARDS